MVTKNNRIPMVNIIEPKTGKIKFMYEEKSGDFFVCIPIHFENPNFIYYDEDNAYLQFDAIQLDGEEEPISDFILQLAKRRYGQLFECLTVISEDKKFYQISIQAHPSTNLLEVMKGTGLGISLDSD
jgi:hypothetical protein